MNWYLQNGEKSDVVLDSKIELSRNIIDFPFENKCTKSDRKEILNKFIEINNKMNYNLKIFKLKDMDSITIRTLIEKKLINNDFIENKDENTAIAINEDENICIMINGEDHFKIQIFTPGLEIEDGIKLITEIDNKMEENLDYAYSDKYGFLTSSLANVGTGMRSYIYVHLPALGLTQNVHKIIEIINKFGMNIIDLKNDIYIISNKQTLGISENEIINNLKIIVDKVIEQERLARKFLEKSAIELEDNIYRNYGILSNCRIISFDDAMNLLSKVKLGTDLGIIKEMDDLKIKKLYFYIKSGNLQRYLGKKIDNIYDVNVSRADMIRKIIKNI